MKSSEVPSAFMRHIAWIGLVLIMSNASAQETQDEVTATSHSSAYDAIVASLGHEGGSYWQVMALDDYPAIGRAVANVDHITHVAPEEQASTARFFEEVQARGADGISLGGKDYIIGITLGQGAPAMDDTSQNAPGVALPLLVAALAGAVLRKH